jgi:uncharacterized protein YbjT (DUF2867 family)
MFVVTGVSGRTGGAAADVLLAARRPVRVVVRDAVKGEPWKAKGADVCVASFEDRETFVGALRGVEGAYLLFPPFGFGDTGVPAARKRLRDALLGVVLQARPQHVVLLSSIGAQHTDGTGPIADLHPVETALSASGIPTTILRAGYFMENWGPMVAGAVESGALYHGLEAGKKIPQVATRDIGAAAADLLLHPTRSGTRVVHLSGPEEYSLLDTAAALSRVAGRPIQGVQVPIEGMMGAMQGMGASAEVARIYGEMVAAINSGRVAWEDGNATVRRGTTSLDTVLQTLLGG